MTRYVMRVDIFEVNISAPPQIRSLAYQYFFLSHSCNINKNIKYRQSFVFELLSYFYLFWTHCSSVNVSSTILSHHWDDAFLFHMSFLWDNPNVSPTRTHWSSLFLFCQRKKIVSRHPYSTSIKKILMPIEKYPWRFNSCEHNVTLLLALFTYLSIFTYM